MRSLHGCPTLPDVLAARAFLKRYLLRTPLVRNIALSRMIGADVYVKHENHTPIGSFKVRGALNALNALTPEERSRGVVTASTGNHGMGVAYASRIMGIRSAVYVPEGGNPEKVQAIRDLQGSGDGPGGEVVFAGTDFNLAKAAAKARCEAEGAAFIDDGTNAALMAGAGTLAFEVMEEIPDLDAFLIPVGGGALIAGCGTAIKGVNPKTRVIGVQSDAGPAAYYSWRAGKPVEHPPTTFADGLSTRTVEPLTLDLMRNVVDEMTLVSESDLYEGVRILLQTTHNLAEGAAAAPLMGALKLRDQLDGKKIALLFSGANLTLPKLREIVGA